MEILEETKKLANELSKVKSVDDVLNLAKSFGLDLDAKEASDILTKLTSKELSDEELEDIAGGIWPFANKAVNLEKEDDDNKKPHKQHFTSI